MKIWNSVWAGQIKEDFEQREYTVDFDRMAGNL